MIIETTKQDELDEISFKSKQEIDSLNHIISNRPLLLSNNFREKIYKKGKTSSIKLKNGIIF